MTRLSVFAALLLTLGLVGGMARSAGVEQTFEFYCAQCHGTDGKGKGPNVTKDFATSPRNFTNAKEMDKLSDADLKNVIIDGGPSVGKSSLMPPWGKTLTGEDVDALVGHLRKLCQCKGKQG